MYYQRERGLNLTRRFLAAANQLVNLHKDLLERIKRYLQNYSIKLLMVMPLLMLTDGKSSENIVSCMERLWAQKQAAWEIFWSELDVDSRNSVGTPCGRRVTSLGPDAIAEYDWMSGYLFSIIGPITSRMKFKSIVAERVLGLPQNEIKTKNYNAS